MDGTAERGNLDDAYVSEKTHKNVELDGRLWDVVLKDIPWPEYRELTIEFAGKGGKNDPKGELRMQARVAELAVVALNGKPIDWSQITKDLGLALQTFAVRKTMEGFRKNS